MKHGPRGEEPDLSHRVQINHVRSTYEAAWLRLPLEGSTSMAPHISYKNFCHPKEWCAQNIVIYISSGLSLAAMLFVVLRILVYRLQKRAGPETSIGGLVQHLVLVLGIIDICYHLPDLFYVLDQSAAPVSVLIKDNDIGSRTSNTMIYQYLREGLGLLSLLWHISIAHVMYSWLVLKHSVARLRRRRIWLYVLAAGAVTTSRYLLFFNCGETGLLLSTLMYDVFFVPGCLLLMMRYYYLSVSELGAGLGPLSPLRRFSVSYFTSSQAIASGCPSDDVELEDGSSAAQRWVDGRYRPIILRLLRISVLVASTWFMATLFDAITWFHFLNTGRSVPKAIFVLRLILTRIIGLMDAIILGGLFECRPLAGREGPGTGERDCVGTSSSEALPKVPLQHLEEGMGVGQSSGSSGASYPPTAGASVMEGVSELNGSSVVSAEGGGRGVGPEDSASDTTKTPRAATAGGDRCNKACIFVSSWNMGGVAAAEVEESLGGERGALKDWLPKTGFDAYVIGCQECLCFGTLKRLIHEFLGGPEEWVLFSDEIGDAVVLHGKIALAVLARAGDVRSGAFSIWQSSVNRVAAGVKLGPVRAANKGMVGLSIRWHDTSLAVMTAHFASDKKGKNRVDKRNQDASKMLRNLSLLWDQSGLEAHTQHHHAILLGDLNYRVLSTPPHVLSLIQQSAEVMATPPVAALHEPSSLSSASGSSFNSVGAVKVPAVGWRPASYERFFQMGVDKGKSHVTGVDPSSSAWSWVRELDELSQCMAQRLVFDGWREGPIAFPPTYRWERGAWAADFTTPPIIASSYTTSVAEGPNPSSSSEADPSPSPLPPAQGVSWAGALSPSSSTASSAPVSSVPAPPLPPLTVTCTPRTPSYTDRILTHSLPGRQGGLSWVHYDAVDCITLSDHRPVAAALTLALDRSVVMHGAEGTEPFSEVDLEGGSLRGLSGENAAILHVTLSQLRMRSGVGGEEVGEPKDLLVAFPLVSEDELAFLRKAAALDEVMPGPRFGAVSWLDPSLLSATRTFPFPPSSSSSSSSPPLTFSVLAARSRSQHMVLRLSDRRGGEIGQGVVVLHPSASVSASHTSQTDGSQASQAGAGEEVAVDLTSGGAYRATLHLQVGVRRQSVVSMLRKLSTTSSQSSGGGGGQQQPQDHPLGTPHGRRRGGKGGGHL